MPAGLMYSFEGLHRTCSDREGKCMAVLWVDLSCGQLDWLLMSTYRLEPKLEEKRRLERDLWMSTTLLALGLVEKKGEQGNKLETFTCCFVRPESYRWLWIKI